MVRVHRGPPLVSEWILNLCDSVAWFRATLEGDGPAGGWGSDADAIQVTQQAEIGTALQGFGLDPRDPELGRSLTSSVTP